MNVRKVRMTMTYDTPMVVMKPVKEGGSPEPLYIFWLTDFEFKDGNIRWTIKTSEGVMTSGGVGVVSLAQVGNYGGISVVIPMPLTIHKRTPAMSPEFLIMIPENLRVYPLPSLKKKFGASVSLFR